MGDSKMDPWMGQGGEQRGWKVIVVSHLIVVEIHTASLIHFFTVPCQAEYQE